MTEVVRIHEVGAADRFVLETVETPVPATGEVLVSQRFAGVNYVDVYHRSGLYPLPKMPAILGVEGAGVIEGLGPGVEGLSVGDRVAYALPFTGAYASARTVPAERMIVLPETVSEEAAAGSMLRGVTAHMLLHRVFPVGPGTTVLVHAAAGGLGLILCQWAKLLGATVIGTVGSPEKAELARAAGADHTVLYRDRDFVEAVLALTGGKGVNVAYDGIGGETLARTLEAVRPFGMVASIGQAGCPAPAVELSQLGPRRSLCLSRPSAFAYMADVAAYREAATAFISLLAKGSLDVRIGARYPLADAQQAHLDLEARRTVGSILLVVDAVR